MRGWFCLFAILTVVFFPAHYYGPVAQTQQRVVKVGVYQNQPKIFAGPGGEGSGFFLDILADIARQEGWKLEEVRCDWADCLSALDDGRIDIMPDVAWSADRASRFDFHPTPVAESWSQMYAAPGSRIENIADLKGLRVAILDGSIQLDSLRQLVSGLGIDVQFILTASLDEAFVAVRSGRADVAVSNRFYGDYFYRSYGLRKTSVVFQPASVFFAADKGRNADLLAAIEKHVHSQRADSNSKYYESLRKWMAGSVPSAVIPGWVYWLLGIFVGLLLLSAGVTFLLRSQIRAKTAHLARANADLRAAQLELLKNEQLLVITQEMASVGGWEWDIDKRIMTWTDETFRLHGLSRSDFAPGSPDLILRSLAMYAPGDRDRIRVAFERCWAEGVPYETEAVLTDNFGNVRNVRTSARPVRDESGRIVREIGRAHV